MMHTVQHFLSISLLPSWCERWAHARTRSGRRRGGALAKQGGIVAKRGLDHRVLSGGLLHRFLIDELPKAHAGTHQLVHEGLRHLVGIALAGRAAQEFYVAAQIVV